MSLIRKDYPLETGVYTIYEKDLVGVLCHRKADQEEYLVQWTTNTSRPGTIYSWHRLAELRRAVLHVQSYLQAHNASTPSGPVNLAQSRKRKSPGAYPEISRDINNDGLLTPGMSRASSSMSIDDTESDVLVYNGWLERKGGRIVAKAQTLGRPRQFAYTKKLPTAAMLETAARTPMTEAEYWIWRGFRQKLKVVGNVRLENRIDTTTPSLDFTFIDECVLGQGVHRADPETNPGCQKCKPNMGQNIGCEYTTKCDCLEYAAVDEDRLQARHPDVYANYRRQQAEGPVVDTAGLPKRFPYTKPTSLQPSTLVSWYRESRHPIYECNQNCRCGPRCKSRLVQHGRRVPLTIFKTRDRGWGVKCDEDLFAGEFIDTYRGEIITNAEADARESRGGLEKNSYLYSLDKFCGDAPDLTAETCHVVDGQYMGGPTRFINHSCEPNCRQYTVSYNKYDLWVYDIAFFAYEFIPAGTELTFDYLDRDEEEEEVALRAREEAIRDPKNHGKLPCNCGARKCRGFLWV